MSIWRPDGSGWRARFGVLTHEDLTITESEFWAMAPDGVSVHTARVPFHDYRTYSDPPGPDNAVELLAGLPLQVIVYAFTAAGYLLGSRGEQALVARLEQHSRGIRVLMPCFAAVAAFRELAAGRIALFHPPWYTDDMDQKGTAYFRSQGFEVVQACHFTPAIEVPHPNLGSEVSSAALYDWVRKHAPSHLDGVFIAGNGWRTIAVIAALEEDLGRPVVTANQAALWYSLRLAGVGVQIEDYGQLFKRKLEQRPKMMSTERLAQKSA
jgi:maleate isomerase